MKFYTMWGERPEKQPEVNSGELIVERGGYIPVRSRIEAMTRAGMYLRAAAGDAYDAVDERISDEDMEIDRTRSGSYDLADGYQDALAVSARLRAQAKKKETAIVPAEPEEPAQPGEGENAPE